MTIHDSVLAAAAVPYPGSGDTALRHKMLSDLGRRDLSLARIAEGHCDALAILAEAGCVPRPDTLYGVWASDGPDSQLNAQRIDGQWQLNGIKQYCSGASFADAALVTAHGEGGLYLFDVALDAPGVKVQPSTWASTAFADIATVPVTFDRVMADGARTIGGADWYLMRPGFWHGAIGPASCWAGGAMSLIDAAVNLKRANAHARAHVGALQAIAWNLQVMLEHAGREIDDDPGDDSHKARQRALVVRHLIERASTEVMDRFGRATGPQLLAFDAKIARQYSALGLYIRQSHAERDLEAIVDS